MSKSSSCHDEDNPQNNDSRSRVLEQIQREAEEELINADRILTGADDAVMRSRETLRDSEYGSRNSRVCSRGGSGRTTREGSPAMRSGPLTREGSPVIRSGTGTQEGTPPIRSRIGTREGSPTLRSAYGQTVPSSREPSRPMSRFGSEARSQGIKMTNSCFKNYVGTTSFVEETCEPSTHHSQNISAASRQGLSHTSSYRRTHLETSTPVAEDQCEPILSPIRNTTDTSGYFTNYLKTGSPVAEDSCGPEIRQSQNKSISSRQGLSKPVSSCSDHPEIGATIAEDLCDPNDQHSQFILNASQRGVSKAPSDVSECLEVRVPITDSCDPNNESLRYSPDTSQYLSQPASHLSGYRDTSRQGVRGSRDPTKLSSKYASESSRQGISKPSSYYGNRSETGRSKDTQDPSVQMSRYTTDSKRQGVSRGGSSIRENSVSGKQKRSDSLYRDLTKTGKQNTKRGSYSSDYSQNSQRTRSNSPKQVGNNKTRAPSPKVQASPQGVKGGDSYFEGPTETSKQSDRDASFIVNNKTVPTIKSDSLTKDPDGTNVPGTLYSVIEQSKYDKANDPNSYRRDSPHKGYAEVAKQIWGDSLKDFIGTGKQKSNESVDDKHVRVVNPDSQLPMYPLKAGIPGEMIRGFPVGGYVEAGADDSSSLLTESELRGPFYSETGIPRTLYSSSGVPSSDRNRKATKPYSVGIFEAGGTTPYPQSNHPSNDVFLPPSQGLPPGTYHVNFEPEQILEKKPKPLSNKAGSKDPELFSDLDDIKGPSGSNYIDEFADKYSPEVQRSRVPSGADFGSPIRSSPPRKICMSSPVHSYASGKPASSQFPVPSRICSYDTSPPYDNGECDQLQEYTSRIPSTYRDSPLGTQTPPGVSVQTSRDFPEPVHCYSELPAGRSFRFESPAEEPCQSIGISELQQNQYGLGAEPPYFPSTAIPPPPRVIGAPAYTQYNSNPPIFPQTAPSMPCSRAESCKGRALTQLSKLTPICRDPCKLKKLDRDESIDFFAMCETGYKTKSALERKLPKKPSLTQDEIQQLIRCECEDVESAWCLIADEKKTYKKPCPKQQKAQINVKHLMHSYGTENSDLCQKEYTPLVDPDPEDVSPDVAAAMMFSQEQGIRLESCPNETVKHLFPDESRYAYEKIPGSKISVVDTDLRDQEELIEKSANVPSEGVSDSAYMKTMKQKGEDLGSKKSLELNFGSNQDNREYVLVTQRPKRFNKIQYRGNVPSWFPGYLSAFPDQPGIKLVISPSGVFQKAWMAANPRNIPASDITVIE